MKNVGRLIWYLFVAALNFNLVLKPLHIITGGTGGFALAFANILNITPSLIIFIINTIMFLVSLVFLSNKTTRSILISSFLYPLLVKITSLNIVYKYPSMVLVIGSGLISGYTIGNIIKLGYSTGGFNVLILVLKKYYKVKEYISNFVINALIVLLGLMLFGIKRALLGLLIIIINSLVMKLIIGDVKNCKIN